MGNGGTLSRPWMEIAGLSIAVAVAVGGSARPAATPAARLAPYHSVQMIDGSGRRGARFYSVMDFRACPDGGVLLLAAEDRVLRFDRGGRLLLELKLDKDPLFNKPQAVAPAPDGGFVVADLAHGYSLLRYDAAGRFRGDLLRIPASAVRDRTFTELAVSRDGVVFLWDTVAPEVRRVRLDGTVLPPVRLAPAPGSKEDAPNHLLLTADGLYLAGDEAAYRYSLKGAFRRRIPLPARTREVASDADGNLAVVVGDDAAHQIARIAPDGRLLSRWGITGERPGELLFVEHVDAGPDGTVLTQERAFLVATASVQVARVQRWVPGPPAPEPPLSVRRSDQPQHAPPRVAWRVTKMLHRLLGNLSAPVVDRHGRVYMGENYWFWKPTTGGGAVQVVSTQFFCLDPQGPLLRTFGAEQFRQEGLHAFGGMALDRQRDRLYCVDAGERRIRGFTPDGKETGEIPLPAAFLGGDHYTARPIDLAIGPHGVLLFPDDNRNRVWVRDPVERQWRSFGAWGTGPQDFHLPMAVTAAPDGSLYVADSQNLRVSKFDARHRYLFEIRHRDGTLEKEDQLPIDVEATSDGGVVVLYDFCIARFSREGRLVWHWAVPGGEHLTSTGSNSGGQGARANRDGGITVGPDGSVYLAYSHYPGPDKEPEWGVLKLTPSE